MAHNHLWLQLQGIRLHLLTSECTAQMCGTYIYAGITLIQNALSYCGRFKRTCFCVCSVGSSSCFKCGLQDLIQEWWPWDTFSNALLAVGVAWTTAWGTSQTDAKVLECDYLFYSYKKFFRVPFYSYSIRSSGEHTGTMETGVRNRLRANSRAILLEFVKSWLLLEGEDR